MASPSNYLSHSSHHPFVLPSSIFVEVEIDFNAQSPGLLLSVQYAAHHDVNAIQQFLHPLDENYSPAVFPGLLKLNLRILLISVSPAYRVTFVYSQATGPVVFD